MPSVSSVTSKMRRTRKQTSGNVSLGFVVECLSGPLVVALLLGGDCVSRIAARPVQSFTFELVVSKEGCFKSANRRFALFHSHAAAAAAHKMSSVTTSVVLRRSDLAAEIQECLKAVNADGDQTVKDSKDIEDHTAPADGATNQLHHEAEWHNFNEEA